MSECNDAAPHDCPQCGEPAYLGFGVPAKCVARSCMFYDVGLWTDWVMRIPDDGIPKDSEPDFFADEDTNPGTGFGTPLIYTGGTQQPYGGYLDTYGSLIGVDRMKGESDNDYYDRLLAVYNLPPTRRP